MKGVKLTPALIAIDALLLIVLAALWFAPGPPARWRNWQAPAPQAPNLDEARAAQLAPSPALRRDYPAIIQRPLFAADRSPHAAASEPQTAAAPPPETLDQVKLYGLVDGPAAQGVLLEQSGQSQFLRRGEKIGDWTLEAIEGRNAIFVKGDERRTVPLPDSLTDTASAPAAAGTAAPGRAVAPRPGPAARPPPMPAHGRAPRPAPPPVLHNPGDTQAADTQPQPQPAVIDLPEVSSP